MPKISSSAVAPSAVPKRISLPAITKSFVSEPAAAAVKPIAEEAAVKPVIKEEL
jgi:hypothetical protein